MKILSLYRSTLFVLIVVAPHFASIDVADQAIFHSNKLIEDSKISVLPSAADSTGNDAMTAASSSNRRASTTSIMNGPSRKKSSPLPKKDLSGRLLNSSPEWTQLGNDIDGRNTAEFSGYSVAVGDNGNVVAIGAPGANGGSIENGQTRVYKWNGLVWTQLGEDIDGVGAGDNSGRAVDLSRDGTRLGIGAIFNDGNGFNSGHVRIYNWNGAAWTQLGGDIEGEAEEDIAGWSISVSGDGNRVAVGAKGNDANNAYYNGHVRVYEWSGSVWVQLGGDIDGVAENDGFGTSVSLSDSGTRLAVGADGNDDNGNNSGHVRIFEYIGRLWTQVGSDIGGAAAGDRFGTSVSIADNGNVVAVGAPSSANGYVRVYFWNGSAWTKFGEDLIGEAPGDNFGVAVSLAVNGRRVAVGARFNDGNNGYYNGHVRVFEFTNSSWDQLGGDINGEGDADISGTSVALLSDDGKRIAIGAPFNDGNGIDSGHVRIFELFEEDESTGGGGGTGGGDPHFKSFNDQYFSFHGECDLVLMNSKEFASGLGIRVHARTTRVDNPHVAYSYISSAAVKVGDDVLEVSQSGELFINGDEVYDESSSLAGYALIRFSKGAKKRIVVFSLDLLGGKIIKIHANIKAGMVFVDIEGYFGDSEGLLGAPQQKGSGLFSRDGMDDLSGHWNTYAEEWQVRNTEPKLFKDKNRIPQHPAGCVYKSKKKTNLRRRRLMDDRISVEDATRACADASDQMKEFCVFDVEASGDLDLALDTFYR